jgi:hypothetical protein
MRPCPARCPPRPKSRTAIAFSALFVTHSHFSAEILAENSYVAVFADGARLEGSDLTGWYQGATGPRLAGRDLLSAAPPLRWLRAAARGEAPPLRAFVEFFGNDLLPGQAVAWKSGASATLEAPSPFLLVEPDVRVDPPGAVPRSGVRVETRWLRRVVWERRGSLPYTPATVFLRDGRRWAYRALRWLESGVWLLVEDGTRRVSFAEIAELHLPRLDSWEAHLETLSALSPSGEGRWVEVRTDQGMRVTASLDRFRARSRGDSAESSHWVQIVQPAWSLDALWIPFARIHDWCFFAPHEVPLSRLEPVDVTRRAVFGATFLWRVDASVEGTALRAGGRDWGWGLGVAADTCLCYDLHPAAVAFQTRVGLDEVVGVGGCVRAIASVRRQGMAAKVLRRSGLLSGAADFEELGTLDLTSSEAPLEAAGPGSSSRAIERPQLLLAADMAHDERPPGADPFDIRDALDWLEPLVLLDVDAARAEISSRHLRWIRACEGWSVADGLGAPPRVVNRWCEAAGDSSGKAGSFRRFIALGERPVVVSRKLRVSESERWLLVDASSLPEAPSRCGVEVDAGGKNLARQRLPSAASPAAQPVLVPLAPSVGREVEVRVTLRSEPSADGSAAPSLVDLRSLRFLERPPGVLVLFDDEPAFLDGVTAGEGGAFLDWSDKHRGVASLQVLAGRRQHDAVHDTVHCLRLPIRKQPAWGEYRYLRFAWKSLGGTRIALDLVGREFAGSGPRASLRYEAGTGAAAPGAGRTLRLAARPPRDWVVVTRDLAADWGEVMLTGLGFESDGAAAALFDGVLLARTLDDFNLLPEPRTIDAQAWKRALGRQWTPRDDTELRSASARVEVLRRVAPGFQAEGALDDAWAVIAEHFGRPGVLRTHPSSLRSPCVLRACRTLPASGGIRLLVSAAHDLRGDWTLEAKVAGQVLHRQVVGPQTSASGWVDLSLDLATFAGETVDVEVLNAANGWAYEHAYWWLVELVTEEGGRGGR